MNSPSGLSVPLNDMMEIETILKLNILQCGACRFILGDTSSLESLDKTSNLITIHKGEQSNLVNVDEELETSKGNFDYGSTFNRLNCKNCNAIVGRSYRTTTPELDHVRGKFSFSLNDVLMFEISNIESTSSISNEVQPKPSAGDQIEIIKLQKFVLALYDRLEQLEAENDMLKSELSSVAIKVETFADSFSMKRSDSSLYSNISKPVKNRKNRITKDSENTAPQVDNHSPENIIKTMAAKIVIENFEEKSVREQAHIVSTFDDNLAIESISWSILNSGKIHEIDF